VAKPTECCTYCSRRLSKNGPNFAFIKNYFHFRSSWNFSSIRSVGVLSNTWYRCFCRYYSVSSACIPNFFVTKNDPSWKFSLSVTILNFLAFTFVAVAYTVIMLKANRNMKGQKQAALKKTTGENKILLRVIAFFIKNGNSLESCCFLEVSYNAKCKKYNIVISALLAGCAYSRENFIDLSIICRVYNCCLRCYTKTLYIEVVYENIEIAIIKKMFLLF